MFDYQTAVFTPLNRGFLVLTRSQPIKTRQRRNTTASKWLLALNVPIGDWIGPVKRQRTSVLPFHPETEKTKSPCYWVFAKENSSYVKPLSETLWIIPSSRVMILWKEILVSSFVMYFLVECHRLPLCWREGRRVYGQYLKHSATQTVSCWWIALQEIGCTFHFGFSPPVSPCPLMDVLIGSETDVWCLNGVLTRFGAAPSTV